MPASKSTGSGTLFKRLTDVEKGLVALKTEVAELATLLEIDDERLNDQEAAIAALDADIALLTDVALRTRKRARAELLKLARRSKRRARRSRTDTR